jgi:hypothetical protein
LNKTRYRGGKSGCSPTVPGPNSRGGALAGRQKGDFSLRGCPCARERTLSIAISVF